MQEAIDILDDEGESGLTFRVLAARLKTGHGAIQWHVRTKSDLVEFAATEVMRRALSLDADDDLPPRDAIARIARSVFNCVDAHFWVGAKLAGSPWPLATMLLFERIGRRVVLLTEEPQTRLSATTALLHYMIGSSGQNAANTISSAARLGRAVALDAAAARWSNLDPSIFPFTRSVAAQLRGHDDADDFIAGVDLIVRGISAS